MRQILMKVLALLGLCGVFVVSWNCDTDLLDPAINTYTLQPTRIALDSARVAYLGAAGTVVLANVEERADQDGGNLLFNGMTGDCPPGITWLPTEGTIPMGESLEIRISFDPSHAYPSTTCSLTPSFGGSGDVVGPDLEITYRAWDAECSLQPGAVIDFGEVEIGTVKDSTLTIRNELEFHYSQNQFKFLFDNPSSDCSNFTIDPTDTVGIIGPGDSIKIAVQFKPAAPGTFDCTRSLSSLREPPNATYPEISTSCPAQVAWTGTGIVSPIEWTDCSKDGFDYDLNGLYGLADSEIYAAGALGNVLNSSGSCDWDLAGTPFAEVNLTDIWTHSTASDTAIWAVGNLVTNSTTGAILRSDGSTWEKVDEGWMVHYGAVWGSALDDVYFVGTGVSTDLANTKHWNGTIVDTLTIDMGWTELTSVHGTASDDVWAVVQQSLMSNSVYRLQGTTWENQTLPFTPNPLHDVWAVQVTGGPYALYAVGEDGGIYHFDGATWTDESIAGETDDFYGVWVSETGQAWVVGQNGKIYHKSGANWTLQNPPTGLERDLNGVWGSSDENVFAVGASGLILRYTR